MKEPKEEGAAKKPAVKMPKTLGGCADAIYKIRQERLTLQKQVDTLAAAETAVREHIIATLPKSEANGVAGKLARVQVTTKEEPTVEDWDAFQKHILKTKSFELLQRRLAPAAVKERWDDGKSVPGVGKFKVIGLSINKL